MTRRRPKLCRLNRDDCLHLAEWLLRASETISLPALEPEIRRRCRRKKAEALEPVADYD